MNVRSSNNIAVASGIMWLVPLCLTPVVGQLSNPLLGGLAAAAVAVGAYLTTRFVAGKGHEAVRTTARNIEKAIMGAFNDVRSNLENTRTMPTEESKDQTVLG